MTSDAALELTGTVPADGLLPGARIRGGDRYAYTIVNRQVNGNIIVRREIAGARATLRPTDRVVLPPGLGCAAICRPPWNEETQDKNHRPYFHIIGFGA